MSLSFVLVVDTPFSGYAKGDMIGGDANVLAVLLNATEAAWVTGEMVGSAHTISDNYVAGDPITFAGTGAPSGGLGGAGCAYVNLTNSHIWVNNAGTWQDSGTLLHGPTMFADSYKGNDANPQSGTASVVTTGGTAVVAISGPAKYAYVVNPLSLGDEGISAAENLYLDPVNTPGSTVGSGNGTCLVLVPGAQWTLPCPIPPGVVVRVNAATSGHKFTVVVWA